MHCFESALGPIDYEVSRSSARRTSSIYIDEKAKMSIHVPYRASDEYIRKFILEKSSWIEKCIKQARANQAIIQQKKFDSGGQFLFLGKKYPLDVIEQPIKRLKIDFDGLKWIVLLPDSIEDKEREKKIKEKLLQWYRTQAEEVIGGRIFHYSRIMNLTPKKIAIRTQKRMWGCCDYNKQLIHINWQIILSPIKVVDYVVIHELCHLVHPNHGKRFWAKVEKFIPDYRQYKKWLSDNHADMVLP